jgi:hypothetical protein
MSMTEEDEHDAGKVEAIHLALTAIMTRSCVCGHMIVKAAKEAGIDLSDENCKSLGLQPLPWMPPG